MKSRLRKVAEIFNGMKMFDDYYEVFKNPTDKEFSDLKKVSKGFRGILTTNGDLYVWSSNVLHSTMINKANVPNGMHLEYDKSTLYICLTKDFDINSFSAIFRDNKSKLSSVGINEFTNVYIDTNFYGAQRYPEYDNVKTLEEIFWLKSKEQVASK